MVNFTGQTEGGNIPHGFGTGTFLDESEPYTYMGHWKHGLASGFGQIKYANGDVYIGKKKIFRIRQYLKFVEVERNTRILTQDYMQF